LGIAQANAEKQPLSEQLSSIEKDIQTLKDLQEA